MSTELLTLLIGPYGALIGAIFIIVYLWRQLQAAQAQVSRQQDLFEEALKVIRDDLVPMIRDMAARRR